MILLFGTGLCLGHQIAWRQRKSEQRHGKIGLLVFWITAERHPRHAGRQSWSAKGCAAPGGDWVGCSLLPRGLINNNQHRPFFYCAQFSGGGLPTPAATLLPKTSPAWIAMADLHQPSQQNPHKNSIENCQVTRHAAPPNAHSKRKERARTRRSTKFRPIKRKRRHQPMCQPHSRKHACLQLPPRGFGAS